MPKSPFFNTKLSMLDWIFLGIAVLAALLILLRLQSV